MSDHRTPMKEITRSRIVFVALFVIVAGSIVVGRPAGTLVVVIAAVFVGNAWIAKAPDSDVTVREEMADTLRSFALLGVLLGVILLLEAVVR